MYQIHFDQPVHVHFIGIGGISMSGLASILMKEGFRISGSDSRKSDLTQALEAAGARVFYGQQGENLSDRPDLVVYTAAIHPDNPEYRAACDMNIPMLTRAQLLGEIMRNYDMPIAVSGTHGKTTTTSMLSHITMKAGLDPTISVGGMLRSIGGNIWVGSSGTFITEACEYTNSFLSFFPKMSLILNIDADHLDFFKDLEDIRRSFRRFAQILPADGTLIINGGIERLHEITDHLDCRVITYGTENSDYYAANISFDDQGFGSFDLMHHDEKRGHYQLRVPGKHNVSNAVAAAAAALCLGIDEPVIAEGLYSFTGTDRRFEKKGSFNGVTVIDDYAHHPTEIRATLDAAKDHPHKRIWCVFQPHTYTRTQALLEEFADALSLADRVILADIYAAREVNTIGISSDLLRQKIAERGTDAVYEPDFGRICAFLKQNCEEGDLVLTMGAGDIYLVGEELVRS